MKAKAGLQRLSLRQLHQEQDTKQVLREKAHLHRYQAQALLKASEFYIYFPILILLITFCIVRERIGFLTAVEMFPPSLPPPSPFKTMIMLSEALSVCLIACFRLEILARKQRLQSAHQSCI